MWRVLLGVCLLVVVIAAYFYVFDRERLEYHLNGTPLTLSPITTEVYKWRDGSGNWHITGVPPETGTQYETLRYDSDQNILPLAPTSE